MRLSLPSFTLETMKHYTSEYMATLVHAFITNRLDTLNSLYYNAPKTLLYRLQLIQNSAAKMLLLRKRMESSTEALKELHWLPIKRCIVFKILVLAYKFCHHQQPVYPSNSLPKKQHLGSTRSVIFHYLTIVSLNQNHSFSERYFHYCPSLRNKIPETIRTFPTLNTFKTTLKTLIFSLDDL